MNYEEDQFICLSKIKMSPQKTQVKLRKAYGH